MLTEDYIALSNSVSLYVVFSLELTAAILVSLNIDTTAMLVSQTNRPFPSSLEPLFQSESKSETLRMKMSSAYSFIFMQIKVIFIRMISHLDSF